MSKPRSKYIGESKRKQVLRQADGKKAAEAFQEIVGQVTEFGNEFREKHNNLAKDHESFVKMMGIEVGKLWGNQQGFADSMERMDLNIIALAELNKELLYKNEVIDFLTKKLFVMAESAADFDEAELRKTADEKYKDAMAQAFERAREKIEAGRAQALAEMKAAQAAREEAQKAEAALIAAEKDTSPNRDGGKGSDIPEGAQVFGG